MKRHTSAVTGSPSVITFSIQVGTSGFDVARSVARALNYAYYDWTITSQATSLASITAQEDSLAMDQAVVERMVSRLTLASVYDEEVPAGLLGLQVSMVDSALHALASIRHRQVIESVVRGIANAGRAAIVGHGAQVVLGDDPGVLKVLIYASMNYRAEQLAAEQRTKIAGATEVLECSDSLRDDFFRSAHGLDWLSPALYDICLNAEQVPTQTATEAVVVAATGLESARTPIALPASAGYG